MIKVRRLKSHQSKIKWDVSLLNAVKAGFLGKIYSRYLKRYPLVRALVLWTWARLIRVIFVVRAKSHALSLENILEYSLSEQSEHNLDRQIIFSRLAVKMPLPAIYPIEKKASVRLGTEYEFPEVFIVLIQNSTVTGASNFLNVDKGVISHNLFRSSHDYTSEELHGRFVINSKKSLVTRRSKIKADSEIELGAVFTDAVSGNYAHFLTEVLPRIFTFLREYPNTRATLIIDYGLHPNIMEALELIVDENIDLIGLELGEPLFVKSLYVVSCCGYVPFQRRANTEDLVGHSDGIFSPDALGGMRDLIKSKALKTVEVVSHKKIFIKRNSSYRNLINSFEIEQKLVANGFVVVETDKISFLEQVDIFSNAEVVVGATGAAFANLIFCKPETKIIILIIDFKDMIYGYWQNMAGAVGNKVSYVLGESMDATPQFHSDFRVNMQDLLDAIAE